MPGHERSRRATSTCAGCLRTGSTRGAAWAALPPLLKGYLRLGAKIGDGAVVDHQFNTTDVCVVLPTARVTARYLQRYFGRHDARQAA
jgi:putative hemolysin